MLQIITLVLVAIALLANVGILIAILVSMGKVAKTVKEELTDVRQSVMPMIFDLRELLTNITPKIESTADDLSAILHGVRSQSSAFESLGTDLVTRLRRQAARLEELLSGLIDTADRTGAAVADTVGKPVRQIAGILASAKAVLESLRSPGRTIHASREKDNRDQFV
jgi:methyl-accepting chemotaxis protein